MSFAYNIVYSQMWFGLVCCVSGLMGEFCVCLIYYCSCFEDFWCGVLRAECGLTSRSYLRSYTYLPYQPKPEYSLFAL